MPFRFLLLTLLCCTCSGYAEVQWQELRLTYLNGSHYRLGDPQRQVLTIEHAAATSWGDSFFFLDHMKSSNGQHSNYAELQPRFSLGKNGWLLAPGDLIKDVLLASHIEMSSQRTNLLYGVGLDLAMPGLKFTQLNFYRRNNEQIADNWQATLVWGAPFQFGGQSFLYDGFVDWASGSVDQHANLNWTSQLKWLASNLWQGKSQVWLGVEYVWWRHKFGVLDKPLLRSHENNVNLLLKWHF
ncbi:MAG: outer membrane protein OmpK [Chromatiaceae bacterium]|jgi:nucleoside-specific outer membrane channel protein Tsx